MVKFVTLLNSFIAMLCSISVLARSGGWVYEMKIRLNSASVVVEVEVEVEAELGNMIIMSTGRCFIHIGVLGRERVYSEEQLT